MLIVNHAAVNYIKDALTKIEDLRCNKHFDSYKRIKTNSLN